MHRQGEDCARELFRDWEITFAETGGNEGLLQAEWHRIVNHCRDTKSLELFNHSGAVDVLAQTKRILVIDMRGKGCDGGRGNPVAVGKEAVVSLCRFLCKALEFFEDKGGFFL